MVHIERHNLYNFNQTSFWRDATTNLSLARTLKLINVTNLSLARTLSLTWGVSFNEVLARRHY